MRIFSSAKKCRPVAPRMSPTVLSALSSVRLPYFFIASLPGVTMSRKTLSSAIRSSWPVGPDGLEEVNVDFLSQIKNGVFGWIIVFSQGEYATEEP